MLEVYEFLKKCRVFYLATVNDNKPQVRPFGAINIFEDKIYLQTGKRKNVSKQIQMNPNIAISGMVDGYWIRIEAKAIRDDRIEAKRSMLDANPELKGMYQAEDDNTEVLYLQDVKATFCSFTSEPRTIKF